MRSLVIQNYNHFYKSIINVQSLQKKSTNDSSNFKKSIERAGYVPKIKELELTNSNNIGIAHI